MANQIGVVSATKGEVFARNADGQMRRLRTGDKIFEHDAIITAAGSSIEITPFNGSPLNIAEQQTVVMDNQVFSSAPDATSGGVSPLVAAEAARIIQGNNPDFNAQLDEEAAAAGLTGGGQNSGHSFVQLLRIVENLDPVGYGFPPNPFLDPLRPLGDGDLGQPTAGDLNIALDEDDIEYEDGVDFRFAAWVDAFTASVGAPAGYYNNGNSDVAGGDDVPDPSPVTMSGNLSFDAGPDGLRSLLFNTPTAALTSGGETVQYWVSADGHTIVGYVGQGGSEEQDGSYVKVIFSAEITNEATGAFSFTLYGQLDHPTGGTEDNLTIPFGFTVTDGNGDTALGTLTVNVDDDRPVNPQTLYALLEEESAPGLNGNNESPDIPATPPIPFIGWPGSPAVDYSHTTGEQSIVGAASWGADGFGRVLSVTVGTGEGARTFVANEDGSTTHVYFDKDGRVMESGGRGAAVDLGFDSSGSYNLTVIASLNHDVDGLISPELIDNKVLPRITFNAQDFDRDPVSVVLNAYVQDDVPTVSVVSDGLEGERLVVDETDFTTNATANFADNFSVTRLDGADGAGNTSTTYSLSISRTGVDSGLVDVATDRHIFLYQDGSDVVGRVGGSNGRGDARGDVDFRVSVDGNGVVTLDQSRAVRHPNATNPDDAVTLSADLVRLTQRTTITDGDGDIRTDSARLDIGQALSFEDDGPSIAVGLTTNPIATLTVDETDLATNAFASFAGNFSTTSSYGADGAGNLSTPTYSLSISASGANSGLVDVATGEQIVLFDNAGVVEGHVGSGAGGLAFTVSVASDGTVTLDQIRAISHPDTDDSDDPVSLSADLIQLTQTSTITDRDGDSSSDSESIDIGQSLVFKDDGPAVITVSANTKAPQPTLLVDDSDLAQGHHPTATGGFSHDFVVSDPHYGADGAGLITSEYYLGVFASKNDTQQTQGVDSGLDGYSGESLRSIFLFLNDNGVVEGRLGRQIGTANEKGQLVFTVSVDDNGYVTLTQLRPMLYPEMEGQDAVLIMEQQFIRLYRTSDIQDADGDSLSSAPAYLEIGSALNFLHHNAEVRNAHADTVLTNSADPGLFSIETIVIPNWALLNNDANGAVLDSVSVDPIYGAEVGFDSVRVVGARVSAENIEGGGIFSYTLEDSSHAYVTVDRAQAGSNELVGTANGEILIGRDDIGSTISGLGGDDILIGGARGDTLEGGGGNDILQGGAGRDILRGGGGDDILRGGAGDDILRGGDGADTFVWRLADVPTGTLVTDIVKDFGPGDTLDINDLLSGGGTVTVAEVGGNTEVYIVDSTHNQKIVLEGYTTTADIKSDLEAAPAHSFTG